MPSKLASVPYTGPTSAKGAFTLADTHPLVLNVLMLAEFGAEYLGWEAETCWDEIRSVWGVSASDNSKNKLQAVRTIYVSQDVGSEWEVFEKVAAGLVGIPPRMDIMQRPTAARAAFALDIITTVRAEKDVRDEVYRYCSAVLRDHGMVYGPDSLEPANKFLPSETRALSDKIRNLVKSDASPESITDNTVVVQLMKSYSVRDYTRDIRTQFALQVERTKS